MLYLFKSLISPDINSSNIAEVNGNHLRGVESRGGHERCSGEDFERKERIE